MPFEVVERLATLRTIQAAREIVEQGIRPDADKAHPDLFKLLSDELQVSRTRLLESARNILPAYLIFAGKGMRERISPWFENAFTAAKPENRNAAVRKHEQHLLLYLQRIAAKNDTFSEFGPISWGKVNSRLRGLQLDIEPGITLRDAFLERWTAHAVAAVINFAPENRGRKLEVPALEPYAFDVLLDDVKKWSPSAARDKWLSTLEPLAALPRKFSAAPAVEEKRAIMEEANTLLSSVGASRGVTGRTLYSALNPIGEECFRESHFEIGESLIDEVTDEAWPWIDLWRDNYAFAASRVASSLRDVLEKSGAKNGVMRLPAFMQACDSAKLSLSGTGLIAPAVMAFQEVRTVFRKRLLPRVNLSEYQLTVEDCHVVRNNFEYPKFDEYTYPSADLQLAAESTEAVSRGDYQWILAELHPPVALLQHCMYWACPDKSILARYFSATTGGRPNFYFGISATDFTAHTTVRFFDAIPELTRFVAPLRAKPEWRSVSPAEGEVYIDPTGDVCLRKIGTHEYLGSFARAWVIPLGFHPFQFSVGPHTPRLRCGKVIVQRRAWTVTIDDLMPGDFAGISSHLVVAVEKLRAEKDLPRFVYIRPTEQALRRSGVEGRDKDTKPVFIDLENYLFLEIFHRWIVKAGEIEVTEMLPTPEQLLWKEADGRRTFELRTLIIPRS